MKSLAIIYGSPTPPGKLYRALDIIDTHVGADSGWGTVRVNPTTSSHPLVGAWDETALTAVADADAVVLSTPVFRGTMTSTVKLLLDLLPVDALRSTPVGVLSVAASPAHTLGAEQHLRDVLAWFGALTAPNAAFFVDRTFAATPVEESVIAELGEFVDQVTTLATSLDGTQFGPPPLAARVPHR